MKLKLRWSLNTWSNTYPSHSSHSLGRPCDRWSIFFGRFKPFSLLCWRISLWSVIFIFIVDKSCCWCRWRRWWRWRSGNIGGWRWLIHRCFVLINLRLLWGSLSCRILKILASSNLFRTSWGPTLFIFVSFFQFILRYSVSSCHFLKVQNRIKWPNTLQKKSGHSIEKW